MPVPAHDTEFEGYLNHEYANQQNHPELPPLLSEPLPVRIPPPPQEVVPIQQPEDGEEASKDRVLVVE